MPALYLQAQTTETQEAWLGELKGGIRIQKAHELYWENGFTLDLTSPKLLDNRFHLGMSYVTSRLGSAMGSNAIKQDNFLLSLGYHFRPEKKLQPFTRLNTGYFHSDYEYDIFRDLDNNALLFSVDAGLSYEFKFPITLDLSVGYNFNTGDGSEGPGTLFPLFYQMSIYYTILNKK
ncbi:hypothetical protein GCM10010465_12850 [Actinomadura fibrosa]